MSSVRPADAPEKGRVREGEISSSEKAVNSVHTTPEGLRLW